MKTSDKIKRLQTDMKSAQGAMAMALVLTLIYIIRTAVMQDFNFYFSMYTVEFLIKFSDFSPAMRGSLPEAAAAVAIAVIIIALLTLTVLSQKKPQFLYGCLAFYVFDTVFLLCGKISGFFAPLSQSDFIDIIMHAFILVFLVAGVIGYEKLKKLDAQELQENLRKGK